MTAHTLNVDVVTTYLENLEMSGILLRVREMSGGGGGEGGSCHGKVGKNWQRTAWRLPFFIIALLWMALILCFYHYEVIMDLIVWSTTSSTWRYVTDHFNHQMWRIHAVTDTIHILQQKAAAQVEASTQVHGPLAYY